MVFCFSRKRNGKPTLKDIEHAVRRNFSGLDELDPWESFEVRMKVKRCLSWSNVAKAFLCQTVSEKKSWKF